jgi:hypothetical protein
VTITRADLSPALPDIDSNPLNDLVAQNRLQLRNPCRLYEVFVETCRPRPLPILLLSPAGDGNEAKASIGMFRTQSAGGLVAIHAGHPEIHQHVRRGPSCVTAIVS